MPEDKNATDIGVPKTNNKIHAKSLQLSCWRKGVPKLRQKGHMGKNWCAYVAGG